MRFEANRSLNTVGSHMLLAPLRSQHSKKHSSSADWSNSLIYIYEFPYSVQKVQFFLTALLTITRIMNKINNREEIKYANVESNKK